MTPPRGQKIALVIGVNETPAAADDLHPLTAPEREATRLTALLMSPACGFTIHGNGPLLGKAAVADDIQGIIQHYTTTLGEHDTLLVYFCGHGFPMFAHDDVFLATYDFNRRLAQKYPDAFLSMRWLRETLLCQPTLRRILLILDCCYAGEIGTGGRGVMEILEQPSRPVLVQSVELRGALVATLPHKPAKAELNHTWFSRYLLEGLEGNAIDEDQNVTLGRLKDYINRHMPPDQQCGVYGVDHTRDFRLAHYKDGMPLRKLSVADALDQLRMRERLTMVAQHEESTRLLQLRLKGFVGRVGERADLRALMAALRPTGGYILIKGLAGEGKSSLIAALIDEDGAATTPHHFIALTPGREYQLSLLRTLSAQLILKHDLSLTYFPDESYPAMRDYFAVILQNIAKKGREETIYLDGLDQLPVDLHGRRDLSFLPPQPPPGIVILLGTRPDDTLKLLEPLQRCDYLLPHLSLKDFHELIKNRQLNLPTYDIERLYFALQHNALYLALASDELQRTATADITTFIQTITTNPGKLFELTLDQLRQQDRLLWDRAIRPILAILLVAQEALPQSLLRSILNLPPEDIRDALLRLGGFVGQSTDKRYFLYHLKFREFLQEPADNIYNSSFLFSWEELRTFHQQLATWCLPTEASLSTIWEDSTGREQERRWYARHHALTHLAESQQWEQLWAIIDDGQYGQAKCRFDSSTHLYALDLDSARHGAVTQKNLAQLWKLSLLRVMLGSRIDQWPDALFLALAHVGKHAEALRCVELLSDPCRKAKILCAVSLVVPLTEAQLIWQRVRTVINGITHEIDRDRALGNLATILIHVNEFEDARTSADAITDSNVRDLLLHTLARALANAGQIAAAHTTIDTITHTVFRSYALRVLVETLVQGGQIVDTFTIINDITDSYNRLYALCTLANSQTQSHQIRDLQQTCAAAHETIKDIALELQERATAKLIDMLSRTGQIASARSVALTMKNRHIQKNILNRLNNLHKHTKDMKGVSSSSNNDRSVDTRSLSIQSFAVALAQAGRIDDARILVGKITDPIYLDSARQAIVAIITQDGQSKIKKPASSIINQNIHKIKNLASSFIQSGHSLAAHHIINIINDRKIKDSLISNLVPLLTQAHTFEDVRIIIDEITDLDIRSSALHMLASSLAQAKRFTEARATIDAINHHIIPAYATTDLAAALAHAGDIQHAQQSLRHAQARFKELLKNNDAVHRTLDKIFERQGRLADLRPIASSSELEKLEQMLNKTGLFINACVIIRTGHDSISRAHALAQLIQPHVQRGKPTDSRATVHGDEETRALRSLAAILVQSGQVIDARIIIDAITDATEQGQALNDLSAALIQARQFAPAHRAIEAIANPDTRTYALTNLAMALAQAGYTTVAKVTFEDARTIADMLPNHAIRSYVLRALTATLIKSGQLAEARSIIDDITNPDEQRLALREYAAAHTGPSWIDDAPTTIATLHRHAVMLAEAGQLEEAQHVLQELLDTVNTIPNAMLRATTLAILHTTLAQTTPTTSSSDATAISLLYTKAYLETLIAFATAMAQNGETAVVKQTLITIYSITLTMSKSNKMVARNILSQFPAIIAQCERAVTRKIPVLAMPNWQNMDPHAALATLLYQAGQPSAVHNLLLTAWHTATTSAALFERLPLITPWINHDPTLLSVLLESLSWVDTQLSILAANDEIQNTMTDGW